MSVRWLADSSEAEVRRALAAAMPDLSVRALAIRPRHHQSNPLYWSSSAFVNDDLVMKFAWSQVRAVRLHREGVLLRRLADRAPDLRLPAVVALHGDPVVVVTKRRAGEPLSWEAASGLRGRRDQAAVPDPEQGGVRLGRRRDRRQPCDTSAPGRRWSASKERATSPATPWRPPGRRRPGLREVVGRWPQHRAHHGVARADGTRRRPLRTEAGVELPGGGDVRTYVDDVQDRLDELGITTS